MLCLRRSRLVGYKFSEVPRAGFSCSRSFEPATFGCRLGSVRADAEVAQLGLLRRGERWRRYS